MSLKDELSLTHTLALFLTNTVSLCPLFALFTHTLPPLSSHSVFLPNTPTPLLPLFPFCSFFLLSQPHMPSFPDEGDPPRCPRVRRRLHIPGSLAVGLRGSRPPSSKSHPSFRERTGRKFPRKERRGGKNQRITQIKDNRVKIKRECV